jgi:hypothetical protein
LVKSDQVGFAARYQSERSAFGECTQQNVPKEHTVFALGRLALAGLWPEQGASVAAGIKTHTGGRLILKSQMEVDNE